MPYEDSLFAKYPTAKWTVAGKAIAFPVSRLEESRANRVIEHERIKRDGARLDDMFAKARIWRITIDAFNSEWQEEDIEREAFYPDELNKLLDSFDKHETGDLTTPTRGPRRCKAREYSRVEDAGERDAAVVVLTFIEDNEDDASASAWQAPSAHSVILKKVNDAIREAGKQAPMKADMWTAMREAAAAIESYANAPFEFVGDMEAHVNAVQSSVRSIVDTYCKRVEEATDEVYTLMTDPSASRLGRMLVDISDTAGSVIRDTTMLGPSIVTRTFPNDTTLAGIATAIGADFDRLLELNPALNPFNIPAGTGVRMEE